MNERMRILELIEAGEISVEEGARRLEALAGAAGTPEPPEAMAVPHAPTPRPASVRLIWQLVFWSGVTLVAVGGLLVVAVYAWEIAAGWRAFGWVLLVIGLSVMAVGWWLQRTRWLSVRVRKSDGPNISLAFPVPLGLIGWGLRIARPFVPQLRETGVDELILAMQDELQSDQPLVVEVNDEEDGEQVQVYFG